MDRVTEAINKGQCVLAVSGALLRDAQVMLALKERGALPSVALSGQATSPVRGISVDAVSRAIGAKGGLLVLVEPDMADQAGVVALGALLKKAPNRPTVTIISRSFNPLLYAGSLGGLELEHSKGRGKSFIKGLPMPPAKEDLPELDLKKMMKPKKAQAPAPILVGREAELAKLGEMLTNGGPIVITGPSGIGRSALVQGAVEVSELVRHPDLTLAWDSGADALFSRLALVCQEGGSSVLSDALANKATPVERVEATIAALKEAEGCDGQVMVIKCLEFALSREGDFFRLSRLELLVRALLTNTYPLRLVFTSERAPLFAATKQKSALRSLQIEGIQGKHFHEIFEAMRVPEVPRALFGPLAERVHGHPMAARAAAVSALFSDKPEELLAKPKFMVMSSADEQKPIKSAFQRRVKALPVKERKALARLAHLRIPADGQMLNELGVQRKLRIKLLSEGLLETLGAPGDRRYLVHKLVRLTMSRRECTDFDVFGFLSGYYAHHAEKKSGVEARQYKAESNRCAIACRRFRDLIDLGVPNNDARLDAAMGMISADQPRFDILETRVAEVLESDPANSDAWLLRLRILDFQNAKDRVYMEAASEAITVALVPELIQQIVNHCLRRGRSKEAISTLEAAVEKMPGEPRLKTRLGSLLLREGRRPQAIGLFRAAMELAPELPDAYGLLGMARRDEGVGAIEEVDQLLKEAVRLAPNDIVQGCRLADFQLSRARVQLDQRDELLKEAQERLDDLLRGEPKAPGAYLLLAQVIREQGGDRERCRWLLSKARKQSRKGSGYRARIRYESALLDIIDGELDKAESALRALVEKDPSNPRLFMGLSWLLEARQQYIPAHAEMLRAQERSAPSSVERVVYDTELGRLQALIEAGISMMHLGAPKETKPVVKEAKAARDVVVKRRKGQDDEILGAKKLEAVEE